MDENSGPEKVLPETPDKWLDWGVLFTPENTKKNATANVLTG